MLKKKYFQKVFIFLILSIFNSVNIFAAETVTENWTIAAQQFTYGRGQKQDSITEATGLMFSSRILENLSDSLIRNIHEDEEIERIRYKAKIDRSKLFLELSNVVQKRDNLVLENYTKRELQKKIEEENKKIDEIREKIKTSISEQEEAERKIEAKRENSSVDSQSNGINKYVDLVKNFFSETSSDANVEKVVLYKNDISTFFKPSEDAKKGGIKSLDFQKEIDKAGIDGLLCGNIISHGNYLSITVDLYTFPGGNKLGSVTEIGGLEDADFISSSIARQLVPIISNSLPVTLYFDIVPAEIADKTSVYIDEQYFSTIPDQIITNSGAHRLEFQSNGYKSLSTSYYFYGNKNYHIEVEMEESEYVEINVNLANPLTGDLFARGIFQNHVETFENEKGNMVSQTSTIKINGDSLLGQFVDTDGHGAFFYIDEKILNKGNNLVLDVKTFDRSEYIEKRRKNMYKAYSGFVVSLIPSIWISTGRWTSLFDSKSLDPNVTNVISNGIWAVPVIAGGIFIYEFVRYLQAADSVLPSTPKVPKNFDFYIPPVKTVETEDSENQTTSENIKSEQILEIQKNAADVDLVQKINNDVENQNETDNTEN